MMPIAKVLFVLLAGVAISNAGYYYHYPNPKYFAVSVPEPEPEPVPAVVHFNFNRPLYNPQFQRFSVDPTHRFVGHNEQLRQDPNNSGNNQNGVLNGNLQGPQIQMPNTTTTTAGYAYVLVTERPRLRSDFGCPPNVPCRQK